MVHVGIHGRALIMEKETGTLIAMNGGYPQTETEGMNILLFLQAMTEILGATAKLQGLTIPKCAGRIWRICVPP